MPYTARQTAEAADLALNRVRNDIRGGFFPDHQRLDAALQLIQAQSLVAIALALTAPSPDEEAAERKKKERADYQAALRYAADRATTGMYTGPEARQ